MSITNFVTKIWNDSVWSKVIATFIILLITFIGTKILLMFKLIPQSFINSIFYYWYYIVLAISIILNIIQLILYKKTKSTTKDSKAALKWIKSLSDKEFQQYKVLFWFPYKKTVSVFIGIMSKNYSSFRNDPLFRDLVEHKVIKLEDEYYRGSSYDIDRNVYKFLEERLPDVPQILLDLFDQYLFEDFFGESGQGIIEHYLS
jgi:hypothetical protein